MTVAPEFVVIDKVQKLPKLLDVVHRLDGKQKFILTGSSARKLPRGKGNLLAGRAFANYLFPLTARELGNAFALDDVLRWGTLPATVTMAPEAKREYLRTYVQTYLREEILQEQLTRRVDPFRRFLEIAAQHNGCELNFARLSRDIGVDDKTVRTFFLYS